MKKLKTMHTFHCKENQFYQKQSNDNTDIEPEDNEDINK